MGLTPLPSRPLRANWNAFHCKGRGDKWLVLLLECSPYRGAYLTDFFKDIINSSTRSVQHTVVKNPALVKQTAEIALPGEK
jgi:hypothetical protein